MDKKGVTWTTVISLIAVLISGTVLIGIFSPNVFGAKIQTSIDRTVCELSIFLKYSATKATFGLKESGALKCKTEEIEIKKADEKKAMKILADQMRYCWDKLGEGKVDFLGDIDFGESDARCLVCSSIKTKEDKIKIDTKGFSEFLNKNSYKIGTKTTYASFFRGTENAEIDFGEKSEIIIDDKNPTYVIFMATKSFDSWQNQAFRGLGVAGITAGAGLKYGGVPGAKLGLVVGVIGGVATAVAYKSQFNPTILVDNGLGINERCDGLE